ncbi:hypothetical protein Pint_27097 [Pistacia integerrima]|uniref:Uncharacterized protein n=1 Tax=Pistacia integerrima TaxID=434235 RepID=A0ACC0YV39_9ROSI|nr:hypothetical protein Pint_27097 [Pistacia integerrima]
MLLNNISYNFVVTL